MDSDETSNCWWAVLIFLGILEEFRRMMDQEEPKEWILLKRSRSCSIEVDPALKEWILLKGTGSCSKEVDPAQNE